MLRSPPATRRGHTVAYLAFAAAGVAAAVVPSPAVKATATSTILIWLWVVFLVVGGLTSAAGRIQGRWVGEFAGIPLLAAAFVIYAASIFWSNFLDGRWTGLTAGFALVAIFSMVVARWFEVNQIREEAVQRARGQRADMDSDKAAARQRRDAGLGA